MKKKKTTSALSLKTLSKRTRQKESTSILKKVVKGTKESSGPSPGKVSPGKIRLKTGAFPIVGIGASAGGLEACTQLLRHLLMAQELERARIAGDIHDSLGASLAAIKFRADSLIQESHRCGNHVLTSGLDTINRMVQENIDEVRRLQQNLRPPLLDDLGILTTVEWFCREFQTTYPDIRIEKLIDSKEEEVPQSLKIVIFRIIQEALSNVAKHGRADLVDLSLEKSNGKIELSVRDNGQGFDVNKVLSEEDSRRGLGLTRMKERTIHSGGTFTIDSAKGKGTVIRASWPSE